MSPELIVAAIVASLLVGAITIRRARRTNAALLARHHKARAEEQVMADLATWRADKRMRDTREDPAKCEAFWALPVHIPQQRKET